MDAHVDGAALDVEDFRYLARGHADVVGEHEGSPLFDGEAEERSLDLVTVADPGDLVDWIRPLDRLDCDLHHPTLRPADLVDARVDEESMHPSIESIAVLETADVAPRVESVSWTASSAAYWSRKMRLATANSLWYTPVAKASNASWSPL